MRDAQGRYRETRSSRHFGSSAGQKIESLCVCVDKVLMERTRGGNKVTNSIEHTKNKPNRTSVQFNNPVNKYAFIRFFRALRLVLRSLDNDS